MAKLIRVFLLLLLLSPSGELAAQTEASPAAPGPEPAALSEPATEVFPPPLPAGADGEPLAGLGAGLPLSGFDVIWNIGVFLLVLALLYLVLKALGRAGRLRGSGSGRSGFTLKGIQALDSRKYLAAVEIEGRLIVVGVSPDRITPVASWFAGQADEGFGDFEEKGADQPLTLPDEPGDGRFNLGLGQGGDKDKK